MSVLNITHIIPVHLLTLCYICPVYVDDGMRSMRSDDEEGGTGQRAVKTPCDQRANMTSHGFGSKAVATHAHRKEPCTLWVP
jgi:hypothetical protein